PWSKRSRRSGTAVRAPAPWRTTTSTRLSVPAYTRGGCSSRRTSRRGRGMRTDHAASATRALPPAPKTYSDCMPRRRPATNNRSEPTRKAHPRAVNTDASPAAGGDLHAGNGVRQHVGAGDAPHLGLGGERQPVFQHRDGELLQVVG